MLYTFYVIGALIIAGLAFYAGQLLWQVKRQDEVRDAHKKKRLDYITNSISHIAKAMKAEQCEYSEGVLRIWVLLEHFRQEVPQNGELPEQYPGFAKLYDIIKDMPTHEARKRLSKQERHKMDLLRLQGEEEYKTMIDKDLEQILATFNG